MKITQIQSEKIQILRGISIIAVVCIHSAPAGLPQVYLRPFLNFCVGMFLFLSGMLSDSNSWHVKKRIMKILIPYILWTFIYSLFNSYRSLFLFPQNFFKSLITASSAAVMYYVFVYIQLTLLIPVIDKLARSKSSLLGFLISPLEILFMKTIPVLFGYEFNRLITNVIGISCIGWFIFFYMGYVLGNENNHT
jgi:surface polysaccharide O-acyltransferase-like enzyme